MTPAQLRDEIKACQEIGLSHVPLVVPKGFYGLKGFPRGELLCENSRNERVYRFSCAKLLAWISKVEAAA